MVVRVNDRGPFHSDRVIDLSYTAALKLGLLAGVAPVEVERITYEAIRTGTWRAPAGEPSNALTALQLPTTAGWPVVDPIAEIARRSAATPIPTPAKPAGATAQPAPPASRSLRQPGRRDPGRRAAARSLESAADDRRQTLRPTCRHLDRKLD